MVAWKEFARSYRKWLFSEGQQRIPEPGKRVRRGISPERVEQVLEGCGELTLGELVHCRVRYFCDGLALGGAEFVEKIFLANRGYLARSARKGRESWPEGTMAACERCGICGESRLE